MPADKQSAFPRDRVFARIDAAIEACIDGEARTAWESGVVSGTTIEEAVEKFEKALPRLLKLRDALLAATETVIPE